MSKKKQNIDYQLDLTPFISLLSVCICFLLLTVAWFQIGALSVKQVMGAGSAKPAKEYSLWVYMQPEKQIEIRLKKGKQWLSKQFIPAETGQFNWPAYEQYLVNIKQKEPGIEDVFIFPQAEALYEDIVKIMDGLRQVGLFNMGLSPL